MRKRSWTLAIVAGASALALALVSSAAAQCGMPTKLAKPSAWSPSFGGVRLMAASFGGDRGEDEASIVGMWHVVFTATTSNGSTIPGTVIDNALVVWHSDHTEIMNSVRPPQDGNFCMGVWEETGRNKYFLNHYAWFANQFPNDTDNGIGMPVGPTRITETITLGPDGNHFSGTFTLTAYDTSFNQMQAFTGSLAGTRITTNTKITDLE
jgi:hypothetical protein